MNAVLLWRREGERVVAARLKDPSKPFSFCGTLTSIQLQGESLLHRKQPWENGELGKAAKKPSGAFPGVKSTERPEEGARSALLRLPRFLGSGRSPTGESREEAFVSPPPPPPRTVRASAPAFALLCPSRLYLNGYVNASNPRFVLKARRRPLAQESDNEKGGSGCSGVPGKPKAGAFVKAFRDISKQERQREQQPRIPTSFCSL